MNKAEIIEKYGIERYKAYRAKSKAWSKNKYQNDPDYRLKKNNREKEYQRNRYQTDDQYKAKINERNRLYRPNKYCRAGELELIENYEIAKAENFIGWDIHHRLELTINDEYAHSKEELIRLDMYYNRPYYELIFLCHDEHAKLHSKTSPGSFVNHQ